MLAAMPDHVQLGLTVSCTLCCSAIFLACYYQLWLLLCYRYRRISYHSLCLFMCLLWAGCRTVLYSYYLSTYLQTSHLQPFPHWLLYCTPICLQFFTLCLLNLYLSQVIFKSRCSSEFNDCKIPLRLTFLFLSLVLLTVNMYFSSIGNDPDNPYKWIPNARMITSDCLFIVCSTTLGYYVCKLACASPAYVYLESKGTSGNQAVLICTVIGTLYFLRACYNLVVIFKTPGNEHSPFSYGWNGISDYAASEKIDGLEYVIFGIIYISCEVIPMALMIFFFKANPLHQNLEAGGLVNSQSFGSRSFFFDNPRRYDSDDDLPKLAGARGSMSSPPKSSSWYGTICPGGSCAVSPPLQSDAPSGTPVHFTCGAHTVA
ncbi:integral membrane protein GPR137C [Pelodytes ibericus]